MRAIETKIYEFHELDEHAQEKALEEVRLRTMQSDDFNFHSETLIEAFKHDAKLLGIEIDNVYYSGFGSQGDGAMFTGCYYYKKGWKRALKERACGDLYEKLATIGDALQEVQRKYFYQLIASVDHVGRYCHEYTAEIYIEVDTDHDSTLDDKDADDLTDALRDFMRHMYRTLGETYYWMISDEQIKEDIENNEYEFLEDGSPA